eukprot:scaffold18634_cov17-Tisochrysis_lutea.AAC.1
MPNRACGTLYLPVLSVLHSPGLQALFLPVAPAFPYKTAAHITSSPFYGLTEQTNLIEPHSHSVHFTLKFMDVRPATQRRAMYFNKELLVTSKSPPFVIYKLPGTEGFLATQCISTSFNVWRRREFMTFLPEGTQGVVVQPIGSSGLLVAATDTVRGFGRMDQ